MRTVRFLLMAAGLLCTASLTAQMWTRTHIGYAYPGGGQTGSTLEVTLGGKGLANVQGVHVSGGGVDAEFVQHIGNFKAKLQEQYRVVKQLRSGNSRQIEKAAERRFGEAPDHELFTRLEEMSDQEFRQMAGKFQKKERIQRNPEINELAVLRLTIDADARPGLREMRLITKGGGLSNPIRFMVNTLPEHAEMEPNEKADPEAQPLQPPFIMNGQIMPGDEDVLSFHAEAGQNLVIRVEARDLVPYLADAVPGWFQAVISLRDASGAEVAYADDFHFSPDPAMRFTVPESGTYHLAIRDSIFRGREDFVYRIAVGEIPFVTGIFPLGGQAGSETAVRTTGWNLDSPGFLLDTRPDFPPVRTGFLHSSETISNYVHYAVGQLPETEEIELNDDADTAHPVNLPVTVNGRLAKPGDIDCYALSARGGQVIDITVQARELYSPVDSLVRVLDPEGNVLAWNDDAPKEGKLTDRPGLLTHHADSALRFTAPADGTYLVQISDAQSRGGPEFAYRILLQEPKPGFDVYVTPSSLNITAGGGAKATLHVKRKNGYTGPIEVAMADPVSGLELTGGTIPEGCDQLPVVITQRGTAREGLLNLTLAATADINGKQVRQRVIPADDITQAFVTHHLVEARHLMALTVRTNRRHPNIPDREARGLVLNGNQPATLHLNMDRLSYDTSGLGFELEDGPEGWQLESKSGLGGTTLKLVPSGDAKPGQQGNIVVAVHYTMQTEREGKARERKIPLGALPAIPYTTR